ncbi:MAG: TIGR04282 family arsenosugar biosynthesis glycosyltransferase [Synechococcus sp.]|nr:TIGR04282 family arsenosugar biosynthesis glycosyltransferase [Synechococcus sp.]
MASGGGLVIMARWPAPGRCKRRLAQDLVQQLKLKGGKERSAGLQWRLTRHTLETIKQVRQHGGIDPVLAVSGLGSNGAKRWARQEGFQRVRLQGSGSLGTRLKRQLLSEQPSRRPTLVIGTDLPDLNRRDFHDALLHLQHKDLVLGPAKDGGYWLIGFSVALMADPGRWPLIGIPWGEDRVLRSTLMEAERAGLTSALLPRRNDIDHLQDLQPWQG